MLDRRAYYLLPINVLVASYEEIRLDLKYWGFKRYISFDVVVLDEAQRIKNPNSKSSLACQAFKQQTARGHSQGHLWRIHLAI